MKKISFLFSFILFLTFTGCAHNTPDSDFKTPITLPIETIISNGSFIQQPFSKDKIASLEQVQVRNSLRIGVKYIGVKSGLDPCCLF